MTISKAELIQMLDEIPDDASIFLLTRLSNVEEAFKQGNQESNKERPDIVLSIDDVLAHDSNKEVIYLLAGAISLAS